ncbi:hypothetical protein [Synechococcus sp. PCC 6312]|uniref:hypothetical protein n=1 Tax=Synechococcus sp. (strain ATCC 27167 / PCC 6312) TaxID=195253 RepID=UPI0002F48927|nr:hypothetical protein [Synechococcus sp. PCC 6312]
MLKPKEQGLANLAAIEAVQRLDSGEKDPALFEALKQFNGWGSIWQVFREDANGWAKDCQKQLKILLSSEEFSAARASILNAHYTDPEIIKATWRVIQGLGFTGGTALEPACGTGLFIRHAPPQLPIQWTGVELDPIPAKIAQYLNPTATIYNQGFETVVMPDDLFDLAISNVPFGSYKVHEPRYNKLGVYIHSHFIAKMTDLVRPGGLIVVISSTGTLDTDQNEQFREWLSRKAKLVHAVRLPNNTFKEMAHTEVTTDLMFFQKVREPGLAVWINSKVTKETEQLGQNLKLNAYYIQNRQRLLGKLCLATLYGGETLGLESTGLNIPEAIIKSAAWVLPCYKSGPHNTLRTIPPELQYLKSYQFVRHNNRIYQRVGSTLVQIDNHKDQIIDLMELSEILEYLISIQGTASEEHLAIEQQTLSKKYDSLIRKYGYINSKNNETVFGDDPRYPGLQSLETTSLKKADIFTKRTSKIYQVPDSFQSAEEALIHCLNVKGRVDLDWIKEHYCPAE